MIYALKLLFMVLVACAASFLLFRRPFRSVLSDAAYSRAWQLVVLSSLAAFLCKLPALYFLVFSAIAIYGAATAENRSVGAISVYLLLAVVVPPLTFPLGGVGGVNYLLLIDQYRALTLVVLLIPAFKLASRRRLPGTSGLRVLDVCLVAYQILSIGLRWRYSSSTVLLRMTVEGFLDILIPYYVATRSIRTLADLRYVVGHFAIGLLFAGSVGVVECLIQHNLYSGLQSIYGVTWNLTYALVRGGFLRVQAMTQQPILLAAAMVGAMALWVWLKGLEWRNSGFIAGFGVILIALVATGSRGPWLAFALMMLMVLAMHKLTPTTVRILLVLGVIGAVAAKAAGAEAAVESALASLFGGSKQDMSTIDYRRELLDTSLALIQQSPWVGVPNYASQMQQLKQGEGIIDIVNSYVTVMLNAGVVGLMIYLAPFLIVIHRMLNAIRRDESGKVTRGSRFAISLVAMNVAFLLLIFTSSTFGILQLLLTMLIALSGAWLNLSQQERDSEPTSVVDRRPSGLPLRYGPIRSHGA